MKNRKTTYSPAILIFLFTVCFYFYIAIQVPYTGDDWDWGLDIGLQHLLTADINSRYAGNLFAVIMTHSKLMQVLIMGCSYSAIPCLMTAIVTEGKFQENWKRTITVFLVSNCLLLSMDSQIWQQTYGWVSGFANYGISLVFLSLLLCCLLPIFQEPEPVQKKSCGGNVLIFLLSMVIQLFLENLAVFMVLLSGALCVFSFLREKKPNWKCLLSLAGSLIGMFIMFSSKIYPALFETGSTLGNGRELSYDLNGGFLSMISGCFASFFKEIATLIWENNVVICCTISILLIFLWIQKTEERYSRLSVILIIIDALSIPYFIVFSYLEYGKYFLLRYGLLDLCEAVANFGFFLIVALQVILLFQKRRWYMCKLLVLWFSAPAVIIPLTAVVIEGSRFYITSNFFLILFALFLLNECIAKLSTKAGQGMVIVCLSAMLSFSLFYFFVYREIGICTHQRMEIISDAQETGAWEIVLPSYPYTVRDYVWWGEPGEDYRQTYYKEFFDIQQDVQLTFILK